MAGGGRGPGHLLHAAAVPGAPALPDVAREVALPVQDVPVPPADAVGDDLPSQPLVALRTPWLRVLPSADEDLDLVEVLENLGADDEDPLNLEQNTKQSLERAHGLPLSPRKGCVFANTRLPCAAFLSWIGPRPGDYRQTSRFALPSIRLENYPWVVTHLPPRNGDVTSERTVDLVRRTKEGSSLFTRKYPSLMASLLPPSTLKLN